MSQPIYIVLFRPCETYGIVFVWGKLINSYSSNIGYVWTVEIKDYSSNSLFDLGYRIGRTVQFGTNNRFSVYYEGNENKAEDKYRNSIFT